MSREYPYISLQTVEKYIPEMEVRGVSEVARSPRGFISAYRRAGGKPSNLSTFWRVKRNGFIARHLATYKPDSKHERQRLALIAWAYMP